MEGIEDKVLLDILSRAVGPERARIAFDALSLPPSVSIRVNPYKFRSDQKGLCDELFAEVAGLASPDRGRPRHARGRGPDRERGSENLFSQTLREMGGASRSEESGLPEPVAEVPIPMPGLAGPVEEAIVRFIEGREGVYRVEDVVAEFGNPAKGYSQDYLEVLRHLIDDGVVPAPQNFGLEIKRTK